MACANGLAGSLVLVCFDEDRVAVTTGRVLLRLELFICHVRSYLASNYLTRVETMQFLGYQQMG